MYKKIIAGLGGAIALNILHETIRKNFDNVPQTNEDIVLPEKRA